MQTASYCLLQDLTSSVLPCAAEPFKTPLFMLSIKLQSEAAKWTGMYKGKSLETEYKTNLNMQQEARHQ